MANVSTNPDALPQLIGEFRPVNEWQSHINRIFYGLNGSRLREFYQTFAAADYRLAHALAADYVERVRKRDRAKGQGSGSALVIHEWGPGNGNLAACFLSHLKHLDTENRLYPRVRYVLVDNQEAALQAALVHPDLAGHKDRIETLHADAAALALVTDGSVDRIFCNELWNDLPTKLILKKEGEIEEEFLRPNLHERTHAVISDWSAFIRAFEQVDIPALSTFPPFLEEIVWEKEYRKADWKDIPYRKTIMEFLKSVDQEVIIPLNVGASASVKEAKRVLAPDAIGFSSFDAGTADMAVLNDPDKPCFGQFGGQYSFMVNFALIEAIGKHQGVGAIEVETQKEFVGRSLNTNVISLMDLLATHPSAGSLKLWEQDRLVLQTLVGLNEGAESPYRRRLDFPLRQDVPAGEREGFETLLKQLKPTGVPDTVAYLTEEELSKAASALDALGYERERIEAALRVPAQGVDYFHFGFRPVGAP